MPECLPPVLSQTLSLCFVLRLHLAVSCSCCLLDQAVSVTCPISNVSICTPNSFLSAPSSHRTAPKKPSTDSPSLNLDPESLYPWCPNHSYL
ncbi:hypothetical protein ILYODFUR_037314 [Ilyodon furcidens]|uniref:Secreted protein n=1 Tax=Ilyodon furcidens TaxID=33524 RepID=A0ABV0SSA9_9TELE